MTTLAANIDDSQTLIPISGPLTNGTFQLPLYYTVGSEAMRITGRAHRTTWLVERGIAGTTAATHSSGATLTRYYPEAKAVGGEGGALTVTDGVTIVEATTVSFIADSVTDEGSGEAAVANTTLRGPDGAAGEGGEVEALAAGANDAGAVTVAGGVAIAGKNGGTARIQGGAGDGGGADAAYVVLEGGASDGSPGRMELVGAEVAFTTDSMGFFSTGAVARPQVPASPTEQDIVDALVALGLVTQAAP